MNNKSWTALSGIIAISIFPGCSGRTDPDFIGSAVVETQTYQITSQVSAKILALYKQEGQTVVAQEILAALDTVPFILQVQEAQAGITELAAGIRSKENEIKAALSEIRGLEKDYARISPLVKEGSLPPQQEDKLASGLETAKLRVSAARDMLASLQGKEQGIQARIAQIQEQIKRCTLRSPAPGRVLTRFKNLEEIAGPGQPVFEIGREDTLQVDFFVPQTWMAGIKYGQAVRLRLDTEDKSVKTVFLPATISWIGHDAEFSPKNIQTRESRNELVFRVRALAANTDGTLKRGLPVEVWK